MYFEIFQSYHNNQWRWRLRAANNKIIATSGESYINRADAMHSIGLLVSIDNSNLKIKQLTKSKNVNDKPEVTTEEEATPEDQNGKHF